MSRCKLCGGMMSQIIVDFRGRRFYQCGTTLTATMTRRDSDARWLPCLNVQDESGKIFHGHVAYRVDGQTEITRL